MNFSLCRFTYRLVAFVYQKDITHTYPFAFVRGFLASVVAQPYFSNEPPYRSIPQSKSRMAANFKWHRLSQVRNRLVKCITRPEYSPSALKGTLRSILSAHYLFSIGIFGPCKTGTVLAMVRSPIPSAASAPDALARPRSQAASSPEPSPTPLVASQTLVPKRSCAGYDWSSANPEYFFKNQTQTSLQTCVIVFRFLT